MKSSVFSCLFSMTLLLVLCLGLQAAPFEVVSNKQPRCTIVLDGNADGVMKLAADELSRWVAELTDAKLAVVTEKKADEKHIVLGVTNAIPELNGNDGYAIRRNGDDFCILGSYPKGVLNGVFKVLYNNTDIIWARPDKKIGTICRKRAELSFAEEDKTDVPVFLQRGWQMETKTEGEQNAFWLTHNCQNWMTNREAAPKHGCILEFGHGHNLNKLYIPESLYFKEHPDFYPMLNGERMPPSAFNERTQLCFTNDEMTAEFIRRLDYFVNENPNFSVYRVMLEDNYHLCTCPKCMEPIKLEDGTVIDGRNLKPKSKEWKVWRSTQFFIWYNKLAKFMAEKHPGKRLLSFAYFFTEFAPKIKVMDNVDISFCPIYRDSKYTVTDPHNKEVLDTVNEWLQMTPHVTWREYYGLNTEYPRPIDRMAFADMAYLSKKGIRKTYSELVADCAGRVRWRGDKIWDLGAPYLWSLVQAPWNPNRNVEDVRREYYQRVFGKNAAPAIEKFYTLIDQAWYATPEKSVWNDRAVVLWNNCYKSQGIDAECRKLLAEAQALADNDKAKTMIQRILDYMDGKAAIKIPPITIPKANGAVMFEPGFTGGVWDKALVIDPLYRGDKSSPHATTVKMLHDGSRVYVAMHAQRKGLPAMLDKSKNYCQTDLIDLHFQLTDGALPEYIHMMVDPLNRVYVGPKGSRKAPKFKWNRKITYDENGYDVLVTVPLDQIAKAHRIAVFRRFNNNDKPGLWPNKGPGMKGGVLHAVETYTPFILGN